VNVLGQLLSSFGDPLVPALWNNYSKLFLQHRLPGLQSIKGTCTHINMGKWASLWLSATKCNNKRLSVSPLLWHSSLQILYIYAECHVIVPYWIMNRFVHLSTLLSNSALLSLDRPSFEFAIDRSPILLKSGCCQSWISRLERCQILYFFQLFSLSFSLSLSLSLPNS
jgi:hypothetical protein